MGWKVYIILVVAALVQKSYGQCHPDNVIESDDPESSDVLQISVTGPREDNYERPSDIMLGQKDDGSPRNSKGIFLTSDDVITFATNLGSDVLLSITSFSVEVFKGDFVSLTLLGLDSTVLFDDQIDTPQTQTTVDFDLGAGVIDVNQIKLGFFTETGELRVRNIFLTVCIQTGWCPWQKWDTCSKTCGGGVQYRERICDCPNPDPSKYKCEGDETEQSQTCNPDCCPMPPEWSEWKNWGKCSVTCGGGTRSRRRKCEDHPCPDGSKCPGKSKQKEKCNEQCCPIPPFWTQWGKWSACSVTCGSGSQSRSRRCEESECPGDYGDCDGPKMETQRCKEPCCRKVIEWPTRKDVKVFIKNGKTSSAKKVLRKSRKAVFLLSNEAETQYLDVQFGSEYTVFELGVETRLSNSTTVSSSPTAWPPGKSVSIVPEDQISERKWNKHKFKLGAAGIGPIDNIRLDFGFPTGEMQARKLFIVVCPPDDY